MATSGPVPSGREYCFACRSALKQPAAPAYSYLHKSTNASKGNPLISWLMFLAVLVFLFVYQNVFPNVFFIVIAFLAVGFVVQSVWTIVSLAFKVFCLALDGLTHVLFHRDLAS